MQWYVYLIVILTVAFLVRIVVELVGQPIRKVVLLRRTVLERLLSFQNIELPKPREFAISSRQIRDYNRAVKNVRTAQRIFRDIGAQLLAINENEPTIGKAMTLLGMNIARAGHELIILSEIYAVAKTDNDEIRLSIEGASRAIRAAMACSRHSSRDDLIKIRLEPMHLRDVAVSRKRNKPPNQPRAASIHVRKALRPYHMRQQIPEPFPSRS